jgi:hypothetical protein
MSGPASMQAAKSNNQATRARMATWRGQLMSLVDPRAADVRLNEMCESLARLPRFNGHARMNWSVAHHLLLCGDLASPMGVSFSAMPHILLHDGHEAYIGDTTSPQQHAFDAALTELYPELRPYAFTAARRLLANRWDEAIRTAFGIHPPTSTEDAEVQHVDQIALLCEAIVFFDDPTDFGFSAAQIAEHSNLARKCVGEILRSWPTEMASANRLAHEIRRLV